ncbi:MAG TPA: hypothetical protein VNG51_18645 [Ktedonobacteraceae bacterium]|nr:hypothetical protein [Ktedonobacteraceae bacterium]
MFDPRDPYERYYWHYESRRPLSVAQIIALGSVDAETAALIWLTLEHGASLTVAGPTDPQPGIGKTTTLNALLQFLPEGTALAYMSGMYENFAFTRLPEVNPATTYALCNEVSDHLSIYMWGRVAQRYLALPMKGYHIATSVHADTIDDVLAMYQRDLHLKPEEIRRLGLIINIGLIGRSYPARRRWLTTHFVNPEISAKNPGSVVPVPLSRWDAASDTFEHARQPVRENLARWLGMASMDFNTALQQRIDCLQELAQGSGVDTGDMYDAIQALRQRSQP